MGDRQIEFAISTARQDRHGDTVAVNGWQTDSYMKNPVVLYGHNYNAPPIGPCVSLRKTPNAFIAVAEFATPDLNPMGDQVYRMLKAGFLNATSVGFLPKDWDDTKDGRDYKSQELLEFSIVPVPANSDALAISRSLKAVAPRSAGLTKDFYGREEAQAICDTAVAACDRRFAPDYYDENTTRAISRAQF
jgi:HK97 family phage prohead protease